MAGNSGRERFKILKMEQWAISSEASLETEMNVQRLLKGPKVILLNIEEDNHGTSKP
ncbi:hypothetical protein [Fictibacillus fluitans]|uniref:Uncharacterized protein n=1 Tax=Fictibacillus fluitans TaxID=3058422 RepID=A0ABT8HXU6_9BACL|nr:hypothetical protein [Fictibacillus sp. NE201]MDN4525290.1 hypothetical protein [Fictibacillus sp. NE201]